MTMERDSLVARLEKLRGDLEAHNFGDAIQLLEDFAAALSRPEQVATDEMVEHMVNRFLQWKLPEHFYPDCGITFDASYRSIHGPVGTNLFTAEQAKAMVRHMLEGLPSARVSADEINVILSEYTSIENGPFVAVQIANAIEARSCLTTAAPLQAVASAPASLYDIPAAVFTYASKTGDCDIEAMKASLAAASDTAPSPKGVSDGVRAIGDLVDEMAGLAREFDMLGADRLQRAIDTALAALSQEPVPATAEERAASKEGA